MENDEGFGAIIHPRMREESMCGKYLRLDKSEVNVGEDVLVTWNLPEFLTNYEDWIGMYEKGISFYYNLSDHVMPFTVLMCCFKEPTMKG